ncbi:right-handed parallel beta-helix repeat-containing protein [Rhodocyclus tenuis]|uniref:Right handed beta helix domain-containing protein n=1 Tax=Rhodocyclus tenuis TaxID=1066 RepID=A0A840FUN3_RHOTE|nr:hypothetical protein [Rhodocyclus tenuis]MBB4245797.1 hypothetical protein [Rhodocyclus tenuis]
MAASSGAFAQSEDGLAPPPVYKGEIRRGADGRLIAVPAKSPEVLVASGSSRPATMIVGSGEKITTISEAARLARDGEVIEIRPGDYRGQPAVWTQDNLLIRGGGARPVMLADGRSAEGKAIWVVRGGRVRIENIEFRGARVADGNGAGIRFERGDLVVQRCAFVDNENGILTANRPEMTLAVSDSEFSAAPRDDGSLHHLLYVGAIGRFVLTGNRFAQGYRGHLVKSRARESVVRNNLLVDGAGGRAAYELEFPNGGVAYVLGNVIGQSATTDNPVLVSYGAEGQRWSDNALYFAHNTLLNDAHSGNYLKVWSDKFADGVDVWAINNLYSGHGELSAPAQGRFEGNQSVARRDLLDYGGLPLRLNSFSPLRGSVRLPGQARGVDLFPPEEFRFPVGSQPAHPGSSPSPGAFQ